MQLEHERAHGLARRVERDHALVVAKLRPGRLEPRLEVGGGCAERRFARRALASVDCGLDHDIVIEEELPCRVSERADLVRGIGCELALLVLNRRKLCLKLHKPLLHSLHCAAVVLLVRDALRVAAEICDQGGASRRQVASPLSSLLLLSLSLPQEPSKHG